MPAKGELESIEKIHRDPLFDRTLQDLRARGGYCAVAAAKAETFIDLLVGRSGGVSRERFRFTRNGEYRIKNCRKVDLGCGYRIVCIQKDRRLALLYIGTHDDCFRWIERHRTAEYDLNGVDDEAWMDVASVLPQAPWVADVDSLSEEYEENLMKRIDDSVLRKVFSGLVDHKA
jgi:hypothetical protein